MRKKVLFEKGIIYKCTWKEWMYRYLLCTVHESPETNKWNNIHGFKKKGGNCDQQILHVSLICLYFCLNVILPFWNSFDQLEHVWTHFEIVSEYMYLTNSLFTIYNMQNKCTNYTMANRHAYNRIIFFPTWTYFFRNANGCVIKLQRLDKSSSCVYHIWPKKYR